MKNYILLFISVFALFFLITSFLNKEIDKRAEDIIGNIALTSFANKTYKISDLKVDNSGVKPVHSAFQKLIDSCSVNGGGMIYVEAGKYRMDGAIVLKSNVNLHLSKDATLSFSGVPSHYLPQVKTRWEGTELYNYSPMIYAYNATNIAITGKGTIDGNAGPEFSEWNKKERDAKLRLRKMGDELTPVHERIFGEGDYLRPSFIQPYACSRILIEGVTIKNAPFWVIHPVYCDNVIVRDVEIYSFYPNNDGCDPESSSNVLIENCLFQTGDDAVAIKAGRDTEGREIGRASQNIVVRNCIFNSKCNGLCIGSEMSGGVENVYMQNIQIDSVKNALYFKSNRDRGGYIRNVYVDNIKINFVKGAILRFETNYFGYRGGNYQTSYENFIITNVNANTSENYAVFMDGNTTNKIRNISVENFKVKDAQYPYYLMNTEKISFINSVINGVPVPKIPEESAEKQELQVY